MNLSRKCCRWGRGVVLIILIGVTTGSSVAQAGSEGTSSASRGPSGDAGGNRWLSPAKAAPVKPTPVKPIEVSAADAAKLEDIVKKVETELAKSREHMPADVGVKLAKSGEAVVSPESVQVQNLIDIIRIVLGPIGGIRTKSTSAKPIEVSAADAAKLEGIVTELAKSGEAAVSPQSVQDLIDAVRKLIGIKKEKVL
jgi:hypothetical protein